MECVRPCRSTCCHTDETPSFFGTAADSPRLPHARFLPPMIPAAECTRLLCTATLLHQKVLPVGCTRLAAVRFLAECADMLPPVSDYLHICFLLDLLLQLLLMMLLLSRSAHGHAVRLEIPFPLRTVWVPTIILLPRGFSCCCASQLPQGHHPLCVQLRLHHRRVLTMVVRQPSLQHQRWVAIVPHWTPLVPRARCWSSPQPAHREQGPAPISPPMKLHRSLLSSHLLESVRKPHEICHYSRAVNAYTVFMSLSLVSHRVGSRRSDEMSKHTSSAVNSTNTPYEADSPKRHVTVIVEETKRIRQAMVQKYRPEFRKLYVVLLLL